MRAVVIDDDHGTRELLSTVCELEGWDCVTMPCLGKDMDVVDDADLVFVDVHLELGSGLDLVRAFRSTGYDRPVIVMTGDTNVAVWTEAMSLGVFRVLYKPFDMDELVDMLTKVSESARVPTGRVASALVYAKHCN